MAPANALVVALLASLFGFTVGEIIVETSAITVQPTAKFNVASLTSSASLFSDFFSLSVGCGLSGPQPTDPLPTCTLCFQNGEGDGMSCLMVSPAGYGQMDFYSNTPNEAAMFTTNAVAGVNNAGAFEGDGDPEAGFVCFHREKAGKEKARCALMRTDVIHSGQTAQSLGKVGADTNPMYRNGAFGVQGLALSESHAVVCYLLQNGAVECKGMYADKVNGLTDGDIYSAAVSLSTTAEADAGKNAQVYPVVAALSEDIYVACFPDNYVSGSFTVSCQKLKLSCGDPADGCLGNTDNSPTLATEGSKWSMGDSTDLNCRAHGITLERVSAFGVEDSTASVLLCVSSTATGTCPALRCAVNSNDPAISFSEDPNDWKDLISFDTRFGGAGVLLAAAVSEGPDDDYLQSFAGVCTAKVDSTSVDTPGVLCFGMTLSPNDSDDRLSVIDKINNDGIEILNGFQVSCALCAC
jgi:hypothetical protein